MAWDVGDFCQTCADEFVAGDLEAMAARYVFPLGVYLPDSLHVHVTREDFVSVLRRRRALALDRGTARIRATFLVIDAMKDGRLPLMVEWSFRDAEDREIARNRMRYYCRRDPAGELLVEMVEILRLGFPEPPL